MCNLRKGAYALWQMQQTESPSLMYRNQALSNFLTVGMVVAALFFFQDVFVDVKHHVGDQVTYTTSELIHVIFESIAVCLFFVGAGHMFKQMKELKRHNEAQRTSLYQLREDFDDLVKTKFQIWSLTAAEADVALLLLRGLSTSDIAELRNSAVGTVKVQLHHVLRKSGVSSRIEFMSLFMEEFIDIGLSSKFNKSEINTAATSS